MTADGPAFRTMKGSIGSDITCRIGRRLDPEYEIFSRNRSAWSGKHYAR